MRPNIPLLKDVHAQTGGISYWMHVSMHFTTVPEHDDIGEIASLNLVRIPTRQLIKVASVIPRRLAATTVDKIAPTEIYPPHCVPFGAQPISESAKERRRRALQGEK
ncbi:hypothetical protein WK70_17305 [Burkholderia cepacia]|nr:hypothetical protein WK70_17305 [Burkholderia cepacia]